MYILCRVRLRKNKGQDTLSSSSISDSFLSIALFSRFSISDKEFWFWKYKNAWHVTVHSAVYLAYESGNAFQQISLKAAMRVRINLNEEGHNTRQSVSCLMCLISVVSWEWLVNATKIPAGILHCIINKTYIFADQNNKMLCEQTQIIRLHKLVLDYSALLLDKETSLDICSSKHWRVSLCLGAPTYI